MKKLRWTTMFLVLLGVGVTGSMLPVDAYAARPCRMGSNHGTSSTVYGTNDYYGYNPDGTRRTNQDLFGGLPADGVVPAGCPGPPVHAPDQKKSRNDPVHMHTKSRSHTQ